MKDITSKLIGLLMKGDCTPKITSIARKTSEPSTTIHYNIKKMEKEGVIKTYKAVLDSKKAGIGFTAYLLITLSSDDYGDPEKVGKELSKHSEIESVDICTGDWELIVKARTKDQDEYYNFVRNVITKRGIEKIKTLTSLKEMKSEFVM